MRVLVATTAGSGHLAPLVRPWQSLLTGDPPCLEDGVVDGGRVAIGVEVWRGRASLTTTSHPWGSSEAAASPAEKYSSGTGGRGTVVCRSEAWWPATSSVPPADTDAASRSWSAWR